MLWMNSDNGNMPEEAKKVDSYKLTKCSLALSTKSTLIPQVKDFVITKINKYITDRVPMKMKNRCSR